MKKAFGQFLLLICILLTNGCNASNSNVGDSFIFQNFNSLEHYENYLNDDPSIPQFVEAQDFNTHKRHFAEISDVEEENEERVSSQEKFSNLAFSVHYFNHDSVEQLSYKLQKNIRSFEAKCVAVCFKLYVRFQVYRI
ncbi:hypothetical protein [Cellulophaga baltica]|uniref:hypothetical protein n=1 Tax=Cellulophaga baltica TaxID=76594 RepID=UPI0015F576CB|nr:hypothetical protein [Cellulophaga baltica]MBA6314358.1 hypothetical protein [Cellulophaga baltica]